MTPAVEITDHATRRLRERYPRIAHCLRSHVLPRIRQQLPNAVPLCQCGKFKRLVCLEVMPSRILYLVVMNRKELNTIVVVTVLTESMAREFLTRIRRNGRRLKHKQRISWMDKRSRRANEKRKQLRKGRRNRPKNPGTGDLESD